MPCCDDGDAFLQMNPRYTILERLGSGGAGAVHKAWDQRLSRYVAIKKLLPPEQREAEGVGTNLHLEAAALSALQHPNIVSVYDLEEIDGELCVIMEFINGETLDATIKRGALTVKDFVSVVRQTMEGLVAAHRLGIQHRDIKPGNIMVNWMPSGDFIVKMLDFGLAEFTHKGHVPEPDDGLESTYGSVHFMAPEQLTSGRAEARSDLYSLGCVYYFVLAAAYPFSGATMSEVIDAHLTHRCIPLAHRRNDVPPRLRNWVESLMSVSADQRPPSAEVALQQLHQVLSEKNPPAAKSPPATRSVPTRPPPTGRVQPVPQPVARPSVTSKVRTTPPPTAKPSPPPRLPRKPLLKPWMWGVSVLLLGLLAWAIFSPSAPTEITRNESVPKTIGLPVAGANLRIHLDASRLDTLARDASLHVSRWEDAEGNGCRAEQFLSSAAPVWKANEQNFLPVVDFGEFRDGEGGSWVGLKTPQGQKLDLRTIRTVFLVVKGANHFLCSDDHPYFHRGEPFSSPQAPIWSREYASDAVKNGQVWINGAGPLNGTETAPPGGYFLLTILTQSDAGANQLCLDRNLRSGGQQIGELLIYDRPFTTEERRATEIFLYKKWFGVPLPGTR